MKAAIYSPYLDTLGGGERYMMSIAETFSGNLSVDVLLDSHLETFGADYLKSSLSERFNLDLKNVNFVKAPLGKGSSFFSRTLFLNKYDIFFYLTDGSIFYPTAKKNILHIQSPLPGQAAKSLWGKLKLKGWDLIIYNSNFTREHSAQSWPKVSRVIYPPVDIADIKPLIKKKYILSVGRFFGFLRAKKHELLIRSFIDLVKINKLKGWSLHLAGSAGEGDEDYLFALKKIGGDFPINFYPNLSYDKLKVLYGQSSIYWHAAGFGETDPTKMEHFGISTVEAMAAGAVPVVVAKGGQLEIVEDGVSGFLWEKPENLKGLTIRLIEDENLRKKIALEATINANQFSKERFENDIKNILENK